MNYLARKNLAKIMTLAMNHLPCPPTEVMEGFGVRGEVGNYCKEQGLDPVLVITDKVIRQTGLMDKLIEGLEQAGISYDIYDAVLPDPTRMMVEIGRKAGIRLGAKAVVAIGGGSVMDCAKMVSAGIKAPEVPIDQLVKLIVGIRKGAVPLITIPTTAGTGAEVTHGAIITDEKTHVKSAAGGPGIKARLAVLDPELTMHCPPAITAATGMDALSHGIEGYLAAAGNKEQEQSPSYRCVKIVMENLPKVMADPSDEEARRNMVQGAFQGGLAIVEAGVSYVHNFAHVLGARYHLPHGHAIGVMLPIVMRWMLPESAHRLAELAQAAGLDNLKDSKEVLAEKFIQAVISLRDDLVLPSAIAELKAEDYPLIIKEAFKDSMPYAHTKVMNEEEALRLLDQAAGKEGLAPVPSAPKKKGWKLATGGALLLGIVLVSVRLFRRKD